MKRTGYKDMLRNRCPEVVDYALKWLKVKERWIDHAYNNFIKFYVDNQEKKHATRIVLGIAKFYRDFDFDKSIEWENLTPQEVKDWQRISKWVKFFRTKYAYMKNAYEISKQCGKDEFDIKIELIQGYLSALLPEETEEQEVQEAKYKYLDDLTTFLIKCFEGRILMECMFSVFSDKPSEQIRLLKTCAGALYTRELIAGSNDEPLYMLKPEAIYWLKWINRKILFELPTATYRTIGVRLRIATSMLNGLEESGVIPKEICLLYHKRLIENVNRLVGLIQTEDLPF